MKPTSQHKTILAVLLSVGLALGAVFALPAGAQEVLPRPEQPFGGKIGRTTKESVKDFPKMVEAPKGAPNILVILTDDVGFGASSRFDLIGKIAPQSLHWSLGRPLCLRRM